MPAELDRCVKKLMAEGHSETGAFRICRARLGSDKKIKAKRKKRKSGK